MTLNIILKDLAITNNKKMAIQRLQVLVDTAESLYIMHPALMWLKQLKREVIQ